MIDKDIKKIRNFCIIAHIDHGKSTLADRFLEVTETVEKRAMQEQVLDQLDLERERGITIKLAPAKMKYKGSVLNLIDTPGHVDFSYEVSRSLAAVEGAILLVDASQGIEAQTLSTLYAALEHDLTIIPVLNKIDLPHARPKEVAHEVQKLIGCDEDEILFVSAKTGEGVPEVLDVVIEKVPAPKEDKNKALQALIFDSYYDSYRGVVAYVRVFEGEISSGDKIHFIQKNISTDSEEVGFFSPKMVEQKKISAGDIGYIVTGLKEVSQAKVGDTITLEKNKAEALSGYKEVKPYVFASIFPVDGEDYKDLTDALEKLKLNDASLRYDNERSEALGQGYRCGFLGLLHMDIVRERLEREFDLELVVTTPSVVYKVENNKGETFLLEKASDLPDPNEYEKIYEPWSDLEIITPKDYIGNVMTLCEESRGIYKNTEYLDEDRAVIKYEIPLSEIIVNFYDSLKSISSGYASMNYEMNEYRESDLRRIDIFVAEDRVDALTFVAVRNRADRRAREIVERLKDLIPRQNFEVKIQAAIGSRVIASERLPALRKDVTGHLYGGDVTRKRKLLERQKEGKKRLKRVGSVDIPSDVFIKVLKRD